MTVKSVKVTNYSPGKEYEWTDKTGSFQSIKVLDAGNKDGAPINSTPITTPVNGTQPPLEAGVDAPAASGEAGSGSGADKGEPCNCGTAYVTVTAPPPGASAPPATTAPPATITSSYPAVPIESAKSMLSSILDASSSAGLAIDTRSAPGVPMPTAPTGAIPLPQTNGTGTAVAPPQFTGAANKVVGAGALLGAVVGAMVLVL